MINPKLLILKAITVTEWLDSIFITMVFILQSSKIRRRQAELIRSVLQNLAEMMSCQYLNWNLEFFPECSNFLFFQQCSTCFLLYFWTPWEHWVHGRLQKYTLKYLTKQTSQCNGTTVWQSSQNIVVGCSWSH